MIEGKHQQRRRAGLLLGLLMSVGGTAFASATLASATPPLRLNATATTVVLTAGETATYTLTLTRGSERGPVAFAASGLPPATTASFSPPTTSGNTSTLTLRTDGDATDGSFTPAGDYDIALRATGANAGAAAVVRLKVQDGPGATGLVQVAGTLGTLLRPGAGDTLNLRLTNPNAGTIHLSTVTVTLAGVTAPRATAARPCTVADFDVVPYAGPSLTLMPRQTRTLAEFGVPAGQWPQVRMRNTSLNQDGCQGATVSLSYGVTGRSA